MSFIRPTAAVATSYSTTFPTVENPLSESGKWDRGLQEGLRWTDPKVIAVSGGNACVASTVPTPNFYDDDIASLRISAWAAPANQYAQATIYRAAGYNPSSGNHEVELYLRGGIRANNAQGYECGWGINPAGVGNYMFVVRWNGPENSFTTLSDPSNGKGSYVNAPSGPADGDIFRFEIVGTTMTSKINGTTIISVTDSTFATGQPGMGFWPVNGATPESYGIRAWSAGPL